MEHMSPFARPTTASHYCIIILELKAMINHCNEKKSLTQMVSIKKKKKSLMVFTVFRSLPNAFYYSSLSRLSLKFIIRI